MLANPRDAFRSQFRSPTMAPFDMLRVVSYQCAKVFNLYSDLETQVWGHSRSPEPTPIDA